MHLGVALGIALLSLHQLRGAARLGHWRAARARKARRAVQWDLALELGLPILVLVGVPRLAGIPLVDLQRSAPDIGYWLLASVAFGLGVGLFKLVVVARQLQAGDAEN